MLERLRALHGSNVYWSTLLYCFSLLIHRTWAQAIQRFYLGAPPALAGFKTWKEQKFQEEISKNQDENGSMSGDVLAWLSREAASREDAPPAVPADATAVLAPSSPRGAGSSRSQALKYSWILVF
eukprot:COSAG05_NODE_1345_length_5128_cov_2.221316_1_plen_124_part_10